MLTKNFWIDLLERTIRTFCQVLVGTLFVSSTVLPVTGLPWVSSLEVAGSAALLCVLSALGAVAIPGTNPASASFLRMRRGEPVSSARKGLQLKWLHH